MVIDEALHFRDQFRQARATALRDAEAFEEIIFVLERMGSFLTGKIQALGKYESAISDVALQSPLAAEIPKQQPEFHSEFKALYNLVRQGRNDALHQGAFARYLTVHAVELSLVLEDALMAGYEKVSHFMVRNPIITSLWQPISSIRQTMLANSFSYLPVLKGDQWRLVSDYQIVKFLRVGGNRNDAMIKRLKDALSTNEIKLHKPHTCSPDAKVAEALKKSNNLPILVLSPNTNELIGILTAFDVL